MSKTTITILGAGYVGLTTAALLSHSGYKVYVVEPNQKRLNTIIEGRAFFYEQGIDPIIRAGIDSGNFIPTSSYKESVPNSDVVFSCVGTPDNPDGSSNLTYVFAAAEEASSLLKDGGVYVQKSTVPVGTGNKVMNMFDSLKHKLHYVSNPEFLREGTAVYDTLFFDRVVVGGDNDNAIENVLDIYRNLEKNRDKIAQIGNIPNNARKGVYISTSLNSAELIKVTSNAFLALKISFANSVAKLADAAGADVMEVMDAVGADERIGRAFLNAGRGYGGGCFPKDVSGLIASSKEFGVDMTIMESAQAVNQSMPSYVIQKLTNLFGGHMSDKTIAVLGLSFKAGTSDTRKSPGIEIANQLVDNGVMVMAYDPQANSEASESLNNAVKLCDTLKDALSKVDGIIVATEWKEFTELSPNELTKMTSAKIVIDGVNGLNKQAYSNTGLQYAGIGR